MHARYVDSHRGTEKHHRLFLNVIARMKSRDKRDRYHLHTHTTYMLMFIYIYVYTPRAYTASLANAQFHMYKLNNTRTENSTSSLFRLINLRKYTFFKIIRKPFVRTKHVRNVYIKLQMEIRIYEYILDFIYFSFFILCDDWIFSLLYSFQLDLPIIGKLFRKLVTMKKNS